MSAIITILRSETEESIQMYIDPEEKVENIIDRCLGYWQIEDESDRYALCKSNTEIVSEKTVISSNIQEGDVLRLSKKISDKELEKTNVEGDVKEKDAIDLAERWLHTNIGIEYDNLDLIGYSKEEDGFRLVFKNSSLDEHYTVGIEGGHVTNYIPAIMEDIELGED